MNSNSGDGIGGWEVTQRTCKTPESW